ncbi:hypothetical protein CDL12_29509 [Handroanthus impetiginosus]|uniref:Phytocyanin domain-containing protein n=1 Tax=Handroanthus impetiginosus TaxID=429701 RepID=A0A2G9FY70_9LAMI|nr:hypothetical protein CDL12_29509 [Handroanthus impetiginosus]
MAGLRRGIVFAAVALMFAAVMLPEVAAVRYVVGGKMGWSSNVNYKNWARGRHFYKGDWLFFVYDRTKMNVLEVKKADYERCIARLPLHNRTTGAGRDVVPLNVTKTYYFIRGKGYCYKGMKAAVPIRRRI